MFNQVVRRIGRSAVWFCLAAGVCIPLAAENSLNEAALLNRVRARMTENLTRLPNYTCVQTIERMQRPAPSKQFRLLDMIRLEVALVDGKELFAWPGAGKFEDRAINEMVTGGAIGNGNFALHAKTVFQSHAPVFTFTGERIRDGRKTYRWDYTVPLVRSGYTLKVGPRQALVGYHGSFWVDPETLDLVRLEVEADDIPEYLELSEAKDAVEYDRLPIGGDQFLLPKMSELFMTDIGGSESRNRTTFSGCKQYTGESVLSFGDPNLNESKPKPVIRTLDVPAGLKLQMQLQTGVDSRTSAVGDPITATVTKPVKSGKAVLIPEGALLHGRITAFRKQNTGRLAYVVGLEFREIEAADLRARVRARLEDMSAHPGYVSTSATLLTSTLSTRDVGNNATVLGNVFFVRGDNLHMTRGLRMVWRTEPVEADDEK